MDENVKYLYPNDEEEIERLENQYYLLKEKWNATFLSPVAPKLLAGGKVLDIGCGTGTWILDLATEYKSTTFIGLDISQIFPQTVKPRNVSFIKYNVLDGLPFPDDCFDFVNQSFLASAFTVSQWPTILNEIIRVTKPGGWIEFLEGDSIVYNKGPVIQRLDASMTNFLISQGLSPNVNKILPELLNSSDKIIDVRYDEKTLPLGIWGGRLGSVTLEVFMIELRAIRNRIQSEMGISNEHYDALMEAFVVEVNKFKSYIKPFRFYAQKRNF
nr:4133_t:CDS:2 [Entrophospora candida]